MASLWSLPAISSFRAARLVALHDLGAGVDVLLQVGCTAAFQFGVVHAAPEGAVPGPLPGGDDRLAFEIDDDDVFEPVVLAGRPDVGRRRGGPAEGAA